MNNCCPCMLFTQEYELEGAKKAQNNSICTHAIIRIANAVMVRATLPWHCLSGKTKRNPSPLYVSACKLRLYGL